MLRALPVLLELGLTIFCLIDCIQSPEGAIRNLPRWAWIVLILLFPLAGGIAWLVAGRPARPVPGAEPLDGFPEAPRAPRRPIAPDDDEDFLRTLGRTTAQERSLDRWEADRARREEELRRREQDRPDG